MMMALAGLAVLALWAGSVAWAWRDANRRGQPGFIVAVLVGLLCWPVSVAVWLLARPGQSATARGLNKGWIWVAALAGVVVLGGVAAYELTKRPEISYSSVAGDTSGYVTVTTDPPGARVTVRTKPLTHKINLSDGRYQRDVEFTGTEPGLLRVTPTSTAGCAGHA